MISRRKQQTPSTSVQSHTRPSNMTVAAGARRKHIPTVQCRTARVLQTTFCRILLRTHLLANHVDAIASGKRFEYINVYVWHVSMYVYVCKEMLLTANRCSFFQSVFIGHVSDTNFDVVKVSFECVTPSRCMRCSRTEREREMVCTRMHHVRYRNKLCMETRHVTRRNESCHTRQFVRLHIITSSTACLSLAQPSQNAASACKERHKDMSRTMRYATHRNESCYA